MAQESILRIVIDSRNAERNAQALDRELRSIQRNGDFASRSMDGFSVACRQLAGYMMGVVTAGAAISKMDDHTNLNNRLRLVTNSQQELNKAMKDTFDIAQRSGAAWGGTATIYQKVQYNSEKLGLSQEKVAKITESISKSISNSGSSAQAASAALYQLGQAFDKSSLNGDEFVSMSENAGYLMEVFAKGLGVTRAELKEMSSAGELTTEKMVQAIEKMSGAIEEDFGKTNFTIGQSFTQLNNAATQFIGGAGEASGAASFLSSSIKGLADNLDSIAHIAVLGGVTMLTKAILTQTVSIHAATTSSIARRASMLGELQAAAQATAAEVSRTGAIAQLRAMQLADAQATAARLTGMQRLTYVQTTLLPLERASTSATAAHTAAVNADTLAQNANTAARSRAARIFNAVGGTVGVLTIGVAALAAGYMYLKSKSDEVNDSFSTQIESVSELSKKYRELTTAKLISEQELVNQKLKDFKSDATSAELAIAKLAGTSQRAVGKQKQQQDIMSAIAKGLRDGYTDTGLAMEKMVKSGLFSDKQIANAAKYFEQFNESKSGVSEMERQLSFIAKETGLFGDEADKAAKKLKDQKIIVNALADSYESSNKELRNSIDWLLQQDSSLKVNADNQQKVNDLLKGYGDGAITATQLAKELRKYLPVETSILNSIDNLAEKTDISKTAMEKANKELKESAKLSVGARKGWVDVAEGLTETEKAAKTAKEALDDLNKTYAKKNLSIDFDLKNIKLLGLEMAKAVSEFYDENKIPKTRSLTSKEWEVFSKNFYKGQELKK
ncbi:tape measure protein, partial [Acinetobacter sichuanensis]